MAELDNDDIQSTKRSVIIKYNNRENITHNLSNIMEKYESYKDKYIFPTAEVESFVALYKEQVNLVNSRVAKRDAIFNAIKKCREDVKNYITLIEPLYTDMIRFNRESSELKNELFEIGCFFDKNHKDQLDDTMRRMCYFFEYDEKDEKYLTDLKETDEKIFDRINGIKKEYINTIENTENEIKKHEKDYNDFENNKNLLLDLEFNNKIDIILDLIKSDYKNVFELIRLNDYFVAVSAEINNTNVRMTQVNYFLDKIRREKFDISSNKIIEENRTDIKPEEIRQDINSEETNIEQLKKENDIESEYNNLSTVENYKETNLDTENNLNTEIESTKTFEENITNDYFAEDNSKNSFEENNALDNFENSVQSENIPNEYVENDLSNDNFIEQKNVEETNLEEKNKDETVEENALDENRYLDSEYSEPTEEIKSNDQYLQSNEEIRPSDDYFKQDEDNNLYDEYSQPVEEIKQEEKNEPVEINESIKELMNEIQSKNFADELKEVNINSSNDQINEIENYETSNDIQYENNLDNDSNEIQNSNETENGEEIAIKNVEHVINESIQNENNNQLNEEEFLNNVKDFIKDVNIDDINETKKNIIERNEVKGQRIILIDNNDNNEE